jgi:hypothetical protein
MDTDGDGCSDLEELGDDATTGGGRRPNHPWDFYDVTGDGTVDLFNDIFAVAFLFGTAPPGPPYDASFDRSAPKSGMDPWDMEGPDGVIDLFNDIFGVAFQFGNTCDGKAEFPSVLQFLTGMDSLEELEQLINGDLAPILQAQMLAGSGGAGMAAGQEFPGGYTVVCVYPDGSIAVAPPADMISVTPLPAPTADTDVPEDQEDPDAAPTC